MVKLSFMKHIQDEAILKHPHNFKDPLVYIGIERILLLRGSPFHYLLLSFGIKENSCQKLLHT